MFRQEAFSSVGTWKYSTAFSQTMARSFRITFSRRSWSSSSTSPRIIGITKVLSCCLIRAWGRLLSTAQSPTSIR